ncbi:phosphate acetyltransferase, partial [Paracoccus sp. Z118]|nr:phosphate acetyltransferase [Paracoccus sp. Z118]
FFLMLPPDGGTGGTSGEMAFAGETSAGPTPVGQAHGGEIPGGQASEDRGSSGQGQGQGQGQAGQPPGPREEHRAGSVRAEGTSGSVLAGPASGGQGPHDQAPAAPAPDEAAPAASASAGSPAAGQPLPHGMIFADCGLVIAPDAAELADIAIAAAASCERLLGQTPRVALLSFSTAGSA